MEELTEGGVGAAASRDRAAASLVADPFRAYHRARRVGVLRNGVFGVVAAAAAVAWFVFLGTSAPTAPSPVPVSTASPTPGATEPPTTPPATALPSAPPSEPAPTAPSTAEGGTADIVIAATGYQAELDQCLWVRMDLGAIAPIVGAHTSCGGQVVLDLHLGDTVLLTGQALDGTYRVAGDRDARTGESAAAATAGMTADAILQTCYPGPGPEVRLVALVLEA